MSSPAPAASALVVEGLSKSFGAQRALDGLTLELARGEIHALLGHNGCGKSTLIKILAGYHQPDGPAAATLNGRPLHLGSTASAREGGIRFIHQDLGLIDAHDAVDNIALAGGYTRKCWLSARAEREAIRRFLADLGIDVDPARPLRELGPARRALVAIARALRGGVAGDGLLVLDEPTVALGADDVELLFGLVRTLRDRGTTVLYVTHRLSEVFAIADRVTVMRDGRAVATEPVAALDHDRLAELIVGRPLGAFHPNTTASADDVVLAVRNLRGPRLRGVSFDLRRSEVLGVTGLVGSGFDELARTVFGGLPVTGGTVAVAAGPVSPLTPATAIAAGIAFAPADRKRHAAIMPWTLRENVTLPALRPRGVARWLGARRERAEVAPWLDRLEVRAGSPDALFAALSGGNQQRVVLARWLRRGADVFLLDEPTNGVDVGAKHALYAALTGAASAGAGLLVASGDAEELCAICDRVLVLRDGAVVAEHAGDRLTVDRILASSLDVPTASPSMEIHHV